MKGSLGIAPSKRDLGRQAITPEIFKRFRLRLRHQKNCSWCGIALFIATNRAEAIERGYLTVAICSRSINSAGAKA
jgi:hypothetical protein